VVTRFYWAPLVAVAVVAAAAGGCSRPMTPVTVGSPMNTPVLVNGDDTTGGVESTRRQLTGTWDLVALESVPQGDASKPRVPVKAQGTLIYDEFGNLEMNARTTDSSAPIAAREVSAMSFKGRAVIDAPHSELKLMNLTGNVDPNEVLAPERRRRYAVTLDTLTLSSYDERGQVTAISTWKRRKE
jgi:hypothetical protein